MAIVGRLLLHAFDNYENATRAAGVQGQKLVPDLQCADVHRNKGAIRQLEHEAAIARIERKRHLVSFRSFKSIAKEKVLDVGSHDMLSVVEHQREHLAIDMQDGAILGAKGDGVARHLDQSSQLGKIVFSQ